ncbi:MAG: hypothetical protein KC652_09945 [Cyanobacteria bacterium HKST-UBA01]|nr:hypothetical protein [Cyanobacteria bacterium HKST-UBA01]
MNEVREDEGLVYIETGDGSITLADRETGEWYHNSAGAFKESLVNYAEPAMAFLRAENYPEQLALLDICFGMGYNTFTFIETLMQAELPGSAIETLSIKAVELDKSLIPAMIKTLEQSVYPTLNSSGLSDAIVEMLKELLEEETCQGQGKDKGKVTVIPQGVSSIGKIVFEIRFEDLRLCLPGLLADERQYYDLVFHDPFSPRKFPQFWTLDIFLIYRKLLKENSGKLFTYSVAGAVRSALALAGFSVYRTRALGRKTGGTLAVADAKESNDFRLEMFPVELPGSSAFSSDLFFVLDDNELEKLTPRAALPYRDPELKLDRASILRNRQNEQDLLSPNLKQSS